MAIKTLIFLDAYDTEPEGVLTQKCFIFNGTIKSLMQEHIPFFDKIFIKIKSKSADFIALEKITHLKEVAD